ncbi:MAG: ATP-binding cassette domain-containing protein [Solirubrobacterales bacterium]
MPPVLEMHRVSKRFGAVTALTDVSLSLAPGEIHCLLGDNGAGKSTVIKMLSGVYRPSSGEVCIDGTSVYLTDPRVAREHGIATVFQDAAAIPLMSVARNFFLGDEPTRGRGPLRRLDKKRANTEALRAIEALGIRRVVDGDQLVGTLSGGERQALAIARALHFGARVLILDEPTSALGVKESGTVLRLMLAARSRGVAIVFITHNAHHALSVGDRFTVLIQGSVADHFARGERTREELLNLMAGGEELEALQAELEGVEGAGGQEWT